MKEKNVKDYWQGKNVSEFYSMANAEQLSLQPQIAEIIHSLKPMSLLDYGCGDAFIHRLLSKNIEKYLFDINREELDKGVAKLTGHKYVKVLDESNIPKGYFDVVLLSLVLVCIGDVLEEERILKNLLEFKKKDGKLIVVITHPCFREHEYRPFLTSYTEGEKFYYFNEGTTFDVIMKENANKKIRFTDFHWTLSHTINTLLKCGFSLERIIEHEDRSYDECPANTQFSPFITLILK